MIVLPQIDGSKVAVNPAHVVAVGSVTAKQIPPEALKGLSRAEIEQAGGLHIARQSAPVVGVCAVIVLGMPPCVVRLSVEECAKRLTGSEPREATA